MFNKGQSHGSRMLSLFKHPWAKNRTVDKLLVEDERQNLCGKSLLLMVHLSILRCAPCVWAGLSLVRPWCWELVSKCLRSKAPWCEIASDHWLNIKCLQENQPRRITVGPNLQKVTVVMPERPPILLFRQDVLFFLAYCTHEKSGICANQSLVFLKALSRCLGLACVIDASSKTLALATSKAKIIWSHGCVLTCLEEVGPCKLSSINHRATGLSTAEHLTIQQSPEHMLQCCWWGLQEMVLLPAQLFPHGQTSSSWMPLNVFQSCWKQSFC